MAGILPFHNRYRKPHNFRERQSTRWHKYLAKVIRRWTAPRAIKCGTAIRHMPARTSASTSKGSLAKAAGQHFDRDLASEPCFEGTAVAERRCHLIDS